MSSLGCGMLKTRGFALTELIVVIALIAILATVATLNFNSWSRKHAIEAQTKQLHADITSVRLRAIQTKQRHKIRLNPQTFAVSVVSDAGVEQALAGLNKNTNYTMQSFAAGVLTAFSNTDIFFNERGYLTGNGLTLAVGVGQGDAALNCLTIQAARVNMGRINGTNCDPQ